MKNILFLACFFCSIAANAMGIGEKDSFLSNRLAYYEAHSFYENTHPPFTVYFQLLKNDKILYKNLINITEKQRLGVFSDIQKNSNQGREFETGLNLAISLLEEKPEGMLIKINVDKVDNKNQKNDIPPLLNVIKLEMNILLPEEGNIKIPLTNEYTLVLSTDNVLEILFNPKPLKSNSHV